MTNLRPETISFKQAIYLALTALCIYYPITISANIPFGHWKSIGFLAAPAIGHFLFYMLLILAIDRILNSLEHTVGPGILELRLRTILLSIFVGAVAVFLSQYIFRAMFKIAHILVEATGGDTFHDLGPPGLFTGLQRTNSGITLVTSISIFYLILNRKSHQRMRTMEIQAEQLRKETALAQFEALRNQVNPHFLFNSLSILSSLVHIDANLSEKFIDQLSKAYRYILEQKDNETVALKTELEFLASYAFLLKIRFESKFDVKISITDEEAEKYRVAPLILQLIIENCVKHNRMSEQEPLIVAISIEHDQLVVLNPVRPRKETEKIASTGIGLKNIKSRYRLLTNIPVEVEQSEDEFRVKIPLL